MDAQCGSATNVGEPRASGRREARILAAARVLSIDYRPIVEDAVANLTDNTPDKREEVYAHARSVVERHLQLMRLPEPIIELEKLVLDLTIGRIERQWQAQDAEPAMWEDPPERPIEHGAAARALGSLGRAMTAVGTALRFVLIVFGLRPAVSAMLVLARLLRLLASPIGVAAILLTIAGTILFGLYVDNNTTYRSLIDGPVGRLISGVHVEPSAATSVTNQASDVATDRSPTRVSSIDAAFAVPPDAPANSTTSTACDGESSRSERGACAHDAQDGGAEAPKSDTEPPWLADFAALNESIYGRATTPTGLPRSAGDNGALSAPPQGAPEPNAAILTPGSAASAASDTAPRTAPAPESPPPPIRPVNAKVTALIESGKRANLRGDLDRAVRDFSEAIRIDPKYPDSYSERGQTLFKLGEIERAIADYSAALARDAQYGAALRGRGMAYLYSGKADLALADLSRAIELAEYDPRLLSPIELFYARRSRSSIYESKQQFDLEIADCTALIESYTHDPMLVEALTANYGSAAAANILATIYRQRANAFIRRSNWERAMADLTEAIPLSADRGYTALIDRSKLYEGLGQRNLAAADARAALGIRPSSEEARLTLDRLGAPAKPTLPGRL